MPDRKSPPHREHGAVPARDEPGHIAGAGCETEATAAAIPLGQTDLSISTGADRTRQVSGAWMIVRMRVHAKATWNIRPLEPLGGFEIF
jgi:hypothetical protein